MNEVKKDERMLLSVESRTNWVSVCNHFDASTWNESSESFCPSGCRGSYAHAARDRRPRPATRTASGLDNNAGGHAGAPLQGGEGVS